MSTKVVDITVPVHRPGVRLYAPTVDRDVHRLTIGLNCLRFHGRKSLGHSRQAWTVELALTTPLQPAGSLGGSLSACRGFCRLFPWFVA